ncbi:hypothetical protein EON80_01970 [bacterium]|nr:MAG: hypothetical protein EON80_01970 [bacterium]
MSIRRAFAANLVPAVALWSFAGLLLLLYSFNPPTREMLNGLAELKNKLGFGFSMPAQAIAAGLIPFFFQRFQKGDHNKTQLRHVPYLMACFAVMGAVTDLFYMLQAKMFGNGVDGVTIISKILVDMLIYCPVWSMPGAVLIFAFKEVGFSVPALLQRVGKDWYLQTVVPVWMAGLMVWTPTVAVIYSLPLPLQFPIQAIVTVLWGLILVILTSK